jgi:hypothetical protein
MRIFLAATALVLLVLPASAQVGTKPGKLQNGDQKQTDDRAKVDDRAYRNSLGNLPNKKYDPWKDMR